MNGKKCVRRSFIDEPFGDVDLQVTTIILQFGNKVVTSDLKGGSQSRRVSSSVFGKLHSKGGISLL